MVTIVYRPGDDPRELLAEAIQRDPGQSYMLMPASLARCLGLTEPERIPWAAPVEKCEAT